MRDSEMRQAFARLDRRSQEKMLLAALLGQMRKEAKIWTNTKMLQ